MTKIPVRKRKEKKYEQNFTVYDLDFFYEILWFTFYDVHGTLNFFSFTLFHKK